MASASRGAALKIDWNKLTTSLGLRGNTLAALNAFKKRHDDARRRLQALEAQPQSVDFQHYRDTLKNQAIVDEIEKAFKNYKVQSIDVSRQLKAIEAFESTAVKSAEDTKSTVDKELKDLEKTLENIQGARPFEDLTVDEVMQAQPEVEQRVKKMVENHRWMPAGYREKFGDLSLL